MDHSERHLSVSADERNAASSTSCRTASRSITQDRRLQLLLIAFCFGAFFEGAAGFGTPVAVTGAMLIGLGFSSAGGFGTVADREHGAGRLWRARHPDHRAPERYRPRPAQLSGMVGRQLPLFLRDRAVLADLGLRGLPRHAGDLACPAGGGSRFAIPQYPGFELSRPLAGGRRRGDRLDGALDRCSCAVWQPAETVAVDDRDKLARRPAVAARSSDPHERRLPYTTAQA